MDPKKERGWDAEETTDNFDPVSKQEGLSWAKLSLDGAKG